MGNEDLKEFMKKYYGDDKFEELPFVRGIRKKTIQEVLNIIKGYAEHASNSHFICMQTDVLMTLNKLAGDVKKLVKDES